VSGQTGWAPGLARRCRPGENRRIPEDEHLVALRSALDAEADAQRLLLADAWDRGAVRLREVSALYRTSWELAPPRSYGRLIGMLKAAVIAGDGRAEAAYVRAQAGDDPDSPPWAYALAIAALVEGDDARALRAADGMRAGSPAFGRAADGIDALARGDAEAYDAAVRAIVADFEARTEHVTGVPIADTALLLECLAARRGLAARPRSALLPAGSPEV
jgi:hypothetical protein